MGTPLATTSYSPFASAGLKPPKVNSFPCSDFYDTDMPIKHRPREPSIHDKFGLLRFRRLLGGKPIWLVLMGLALVFWWFNGGSHELDVVKLSASGLGKELMRVRRMQDYQFYPASNPKIHVSVNAVTMT